MNYQLAERLEELYQRFNRRCYVHPDPLEVVYDYPDVSEREIAAFIAAALAYGNVRQILKSVRTVLDTMGPSPRRYLLERRAVDIHADFEGFVHRFATGSHLAAMLSGLRHVLLEYGSLQDCFSAGCENNSDTYLPALTAFAHTIRSRAGEPDPGHLIAYPEKGSACKRLYLFLRWMVRSDAVDPGGWQTLCPSKLVIPLDTHMFRTCREIGLTDRRQPNMKTALEITDGFSKLMPNDPVRYDFMLTRPGIRKEELFVIGPYPKAS